MDETLRQKLRETNESIHELEAAEQALKRLVRAIGHKNTELVEAQREVMRLKKNPDIKAIKESPAYKTLEKANAKGSQQIRQAQETGKQLRTDAAALGNASGSRKLDEAQAELSLAECKLQTMQNEAAVMKDIQLKSTTDAGAARITEGETIQAQIATAAHTKAALEAQVAELKCAAEQHASQLILANKQLEEMRQKVCAKRNAKENPVPVTEGAQTKAQTSQAIQPEGLQGPASTRVGRVRDQMLMQVLGHIPQDEEF